jgi:hypothetical protein
MAVRKVERLVGKSVLSFDCGPHGFHGAREFGHDGVAGYAEGSAPVPCNDSLDCGVTGSEGAMRALFIEPHEVTVAHRVGCKYDG